MPALALTSSSAPRETVGTFVKRYIYNNYGYGYGNSNWYNWGRWVLLGCIVAAALLFFFCCSCFSARRRQKQGNQPYYGTGWLAGNHGPVQYYGDQNATTQQPVTQTPYYNNAAAPAPQYEPSPNAGYYGNTTNGTANGYYGQNSGYGQQQSGIELQQPGNTYQPAGYRTAEEGTYEPPAGPPPNKR